MKDNRAFHSNENDVRKQPSAVCGVVFWVTLRAAHCVSALGFFETHEPVSVAKGESSAAIIKPRHFFCKADSLDFCHTKAKTRDSPKRTPGGKLVAVALTELPTSATIPERQTAAPVERQAQSLLASSRLPPGQEAPRIPP